MSDVFFGKPKPDKLTKQSTPTAAGGLENYGQPPIKKESAGLAKVGEGSKRGQEHFLPRPRGCRVGEDSLTFPLARPAEEPAFNPPPKYQAIPRTVRYSMLCCLLPFEVWIHLVFLSAVVLT